MSFDYEQIYSKGRTVKVEKFNNMTFEISSYTIFIENLGGSGPSDTGNTYNEHYIIELENTSNEIGLFEISMPTVWTSIKNHLKLGTKITANGLFHYDTNGNLTYIEINTIYYNDICISKNEISSNKGKTSTRRELLGNKPILTMLIIWIVSLFLMRTSIKIFGTLFLIDTIIMAIYATINNNKLGIKADNLLEKSGLEKIEQQYKKVSK